MKRLKLFEAFSSDEETLAKIKEVSNEPWFIDGDDAPEELIDALEDVSSENADVQELINLTVTGPGLTDMWMSKSILTADAVRDGEATEEEIEEDNREYIASERTRLARKLIQ